MRPNPTQLRVVRSDGSSSEDHVGELLQRTSLGEMDAWASIYESHYDAVFRYVCYLTGDLVASEDLVQETFAVALTSLHRFERRSAFSTWLLGIAINLVRKHRCAMMRADKTRAKLADCFAAAPPTDELDRRCLQRDRKVALYAVLEGLPVHLREAFVLRELLGCEVSEAAAQAGISEGNMRIRAHRARKLVFDALASAGWIEPEGGAA